MWIQTNSKKRAPLKHMAQAAAVESAVSDPSFPPGRKTPRLHPSGQPLTPPDPTAGAFDLRWRFLYLLSPLLVCCLGYTSIGCVCYVCLAVGLDNYFFWLCFFSYPFFVFFSFLKSPFLLMIPRVKYTQAPVLFSWLLDKKESFVSFFLCSLVMVRQERHVTPMLDFTALR